MRSINVCEPGKYLTACMFTEAETLLLYEEQTKNRESVCELPHERCAHYSPYRASLSRLKTFVNGITGITRGMAKGFTIPGPLPGRLEKISYVVIGLAQVNFAFTHLYLHIF
jgi:hypothetical protein